MAQRSSNRKNKNYSMDTIMLRYAGGVALIALGAAIFLAVILKMQGNVFQGLRAVCSGLCGGLAVVMPVPVIWAGVLMIWAAQTKAPVRPWIFACLAFIGACSFVVLITRTVGGTEYLTYITQSTGAAGWDGIIRGAFGDCAAHQWCGGAAGAAIAWPLWLLLGTFLSAVIIFLLTAFCLLMAVDLTPSRIKAIATGQAGRIRDEREKDRQRSEKEQMEYQRRQAAQAEEQRWLEQQRIAEQQQSMRNSGMYQPGQNAYQPGPAQYTDQQGGYANPQGGYSYTQSQYAMGGGAAADRQSVEQWQEQMTAPQRPENYRSQILDRQPGRPEPPEQKKHTSRIFKGKQKQDGLTDPEALANRQEIRTSVARAGERDNRTAGQQETYGRDPAAEKRTERGNPYSRPDTEQKGRPAGAAENYQEEERVRQAQEWETPGRMTPENDDFGRTEPEKEVPVKTDLRKENTGRKTPERVSAGRGAAVPAVQMTVKDDAFKPELKVPPRDEDADEDKDYWTPVPYNCPPITDLNMPRKSAEDNAEEDAIRSRKLEETLANFRVQARVVNVTHGPAISRFEMELAAGTKVNKVAELEKDIAYGMEAQSVRIEAPIPGKSLVGVELPNRKRNTVTLREVLTSEKMQNADSPLTVALGKDIAGAPIVCNLEKMPHMLIAGQTGSGKSVCINTIINSLLYNPAGPDQIKLILIDPKVVELQGYNGIPHLLIPVVNDPHKAAAALAWAVAEMGERYDRFAERKVRNLMGYNASLGEGEKPMPRIVIIIDELADLMMVCKKDVEEYICRITQLARAAGIHLIVATQRPSVDVITGLIKANIPSRIAFKTASGIDSRTILDRYGAEQLLGWGDMLYLPTGAFSPMRVQGCFLSDEEVNTVVSHVKAANPCEFDQNILDKLDELSKGNGDSGGADIIGGASEASGNGDRQLFEQAVELAIADGQISTSTLQRRLKIGYARAGRLTDEMEERGIVAAKDGSKPRKCLITREEWDRLKKETEGTA